MIWLANTDETATRQLGESLLYVDGWGRADRGYQFCHHFAPVGHLDRMPGPRPAHIMAETVLQLAQSDSVHGANVASRSHIVNVTSRIRPLAWRDLTDRRRRWTIARAWVCNLPSRGLGACGLRSA